MSRVDDKEEVGRETIRQTRNDTNPWIDTHKHHRHHHEEHGEEYHVHWVTKEFGYATCRLLDILRGVLHIDEIGWHTREHTSSPLGVLARSLAMLVDICRHTRVLRYIALSQRLTLKLGREE